MTNIENIAARGYGIIEGQDNNLYRKTLAAGQVFFDSSLEEKRRFHQPKRLNKGYQEIADREYFSIREYLLPSFLEVGANLFDQMIDLSKSSLIAIANMMSWDENLLLNLIPQATLHEQGESDSTLRLNHYLATDQKAKYTAEAHQDLGLLTLLFPSVTPALQVFDYLEERWVDIEMLAKPTDVIVMVGETLSMLSNQTMLPCTHRVRATQMPRHSIVFHLRAKDDALLDTILFENNRTGIFSNHDSLTGFEFLQKESVKRISVNEIY